MITEIKIGDMMKIPANSKFHPEYGHSGKVVWISEDRKTVTVQCEKKHDGKVMSVMMKINSARARVPQTLNTSARKATSGSSENESNI